MNKTYVKNFIKAGQLAGQVRAFGKSLIVPGASYHDILAQINQKIIELGAIAAFPPQMALNHVAAHFILPPDQNLIFTNEIVKLDVGVCYEGAIGDCAITIDLSGKHAKLVEAAEAALLEAEKSLKVGQKIRLIGRIINETIESYGFRSIKNLCGHSLGFYKIHTSPLFPNYDDRSHGEIRPGMTFAIEPFATTGQGFIDEAGEASIFHFSAPRFMASLPAKALLNKIKTFKNLPFGYTSVMESTDSYDDIKTCMQELLAKGAVIGYPPLVEIKQGLVAQAENSFLVDDQGLIHNTTKI